MTRLPLDLPKMPHGLVSSLKSRTLHVPEVLPPRMNNYPEKVPTSSPRDDGNSRSVLLHPHHSRLNSFMKAVDERLPTPPQ